MCNMKPSRRPPETGKRQKKDEAPKARVHVVIARKWLAVIERAARQLNLGRSNFIAVAALDAAEKQLEKKNG